SATNTKTRDVVHLVVDDPGPATQALRNSGIEVHEVSEVFVLDKDRKKVTGKPGNFGGICRALAENGIRVKFGYPAENNKFIFGVDDLEKTRKVLG
ncbi:MAG: hypothetical protein OQJ84_03775, partial [Xanthomonadales bacterium]|nr:hypothetical protein [Xanthomonadales bacterium]